MVCGDTVQDGSLEEREQAQNDVKHLTHAIPAKCAMLANVYSKMPYKIEHFKSFHPAHDLHLSIIIIVVSLVRKVPLPFRSTLVLTLHNIDRIVHLLIDNLSQSPRFLHHLFGLRLTALQPILH